MYNSVQNAHLNRLSHNSIFWILSLPCGCFFQKINLLYNIHFTDLSHLFYLYVFYLIYICFPT